MHVNKWFFYISGCNNQTINNPGGTDYIENTFNNFFSTIKWSFNYDRNLAIKGLNSSICNMHYSEWCWKRKSITFL